MPALWYQLPGALDVAFTVGDEINVAMNLGIDITGGTLSSGVYVVSSGGLQGGGGGTVTTVGETAATPSISVTNATQGRIVWSLVETQTGALSPAIKYNWFLRYVSSSGVTRTFLAGNCIAKAPGA